MNVPGRFVRRVGGDQRLTATVALVGGVVGAAAGARPTGVGAVDLVVVASAVGAVVWASASAPWWALAAASGIGAVIALDPLLAALGAVGFVCSLLMGAFRLDAVVAQAVIGAIAMNVLIRSELAGFFGLSAIVSIGIGGALLVLGLRRRPIAIRRAGWMVLGALAGLTTLALLGGAVAGLSARGDLTLGANLARGAIATVNSGDYEAASSQFDDAASAFSRADRRMSSLWALPVRLVPGAGQNVRAAARLADEAAAGTGDAAAALREVDPASLTVVDGAIDLDAIAAAEAPLLQVQQALIELRRASDDVKSPWLLGPLQRELADLDDRLDENDPRLDNAIDAVRLVPAMLGGEGERRYLVLFTTPAEARGLGGFSGNYAEVLADDGRLEVTQFGRTTDLNDPARRNDATCDACPTEFVEGYGWLGLASGPGGTVGLAPWSNLTYGAHFPYVAATAAVLYPQSGGVDVDGVAVMDPFVIEALMGYTGAVDVPELGVTVEPVGAAEFILRDQYALAEDRSVRVEALDTLGRSVIAALLTGSLPGVADVAADLGPLIAERRLLLWTDDASEQELLDATGLLGALPPFDDEAVSVAFNNAGESKIDVFLDAETTVRVEQTDSGARRLVADVTVANTAPASGMPDFVIGNNNGLPTGTSRLDVTFYGPPRLTEMLRDGEPVGVRSITEAGWSAFTVRVDVPPGATVDFRATFDLEPTGASAGTPSSSLDTGRGRIAWEQPLAQRDAG
jgi:hypothetical protein